MYVQVVQYLIGEILIVIRSNVTSYQYSRCFRWVFNTMVPPPTLHVHEH